MTPRHTPRIRPMPTHLSSTLHTRYMAAETSEELQRINKIIKLYNAYLIDDTEAHLYLTNGGINI